MSDARWQMCPSFQPENASKMLVDGGLLEATRSPGDGYRLARNPDEISLLDITLAVDGSDSFFNVLWASPNVVAWHTALSTRSGMRQRTYTQPVEAGNSQRLHLQEKAATRTSIEQKGGFRLCR